MTAQTTVYNPAWDDATSLLGLSLPENLVYKPNTDLFPAFE